MSQTKIGFLSLTSIIVVNIVGSGVLILPSILAHFGATSFISYIISGIGMLAIGLVYTQMKSIAKCEGVHGPILHVFGFRLAQLASILYLLSIISGNSAMLISFFSYAGFSKISLQQCGIFSSIIIVCLTCMSCLSIKLVQMVEVMIAILKIIPLIGVPLLCIPYALKSDVILTQAISFSSLKASLAHTLWAFLGLETAVVIEKKVRNPESTIPRSMIFSVILITVIYIIGMWTALKLIPNLGSANAPYVDLLMFVLPSCIRMFAFPFVQTVTLLLILGSIYSWIFTTGVGISESAKQKLLPKFLSEKNRFDAPVKALILSSIMSILFLLLTYRESMQDHFEFMVSILTFITFVIYFFTTLAFCKTIWDKSKITVYNVVLGFAALCTTTISMIVLLNNLLQLYFKL
ncbi:MAG: amino acid permease [Alphaproteobacteria bacterium]|nr:MAG: amino acid permease [Alphaproteobacteria bacterium]